MALAKAVVVFVVNAVTVKDDVCVAVTEPSADVRVDRCVAVASGVWEEREAPGVSALFIQSGSDRMAGSTGSINPLGLLVRKSLFGSSFDSTFVFNSQLGAKRSAQPPATRIQKSPKRRMNAMTAQSRLSFSVALMSQPI